MADIDLEAEQVVGEEEEEKAASRKPKLPRIGFIIVGALLLVEAVILLFVFEKIQSPNSAAAAENQKPQSSPEEVYGNSGRLVIEKISVYDGTATGPREDRRFEVDLTVWLDRQIYKELETLNEEYGDTFELVKDEFRNMTKKFLAQQGAAAIKNNETRMKLEERLLLFLRDEMEVFRGTNRDGQHRIRKVFVENFLPRKI